MVWFPAPANYVKGHNAPSPNQMCTRLDTSFPLYKYLPETRLGAAHSHSAASETMMWPNLSLNKETLVWLRPLLGDLLGFMKASWCNSLIKDINESKCWTRCEGKGTPLDTMWTNNHHGKQYASSSKCKVELSYVSDIIFLCMQLKA